MKQIKKILCGVMLTSFVILGSVSVFANGLGDAGDDGGQQECVYKEQITSKEVKASEYTNTVKNHREEVNADIYIVGNSPISHR